MIHYKSISMNMRLLVGGRYPNSETTLSLINPLLASEFQIAMENVKPINPPPTGDPNKNVLL